MKNKILIGLMTFGMVCCTFPTFAICASEDTNLVQPRAHIETVISSYETVYDRSPFTKLYDENFTYRTIQFVRSYTYTITEKECSTWGDLLVGNVRYRYIYNYKTK